MMAPDGGMALALVRGCCAFVLLCVAGGSVFAACMLRGASLEVRVAVRRLLLGGCVAGLTLLAAWVALQAADFADAGSLRAMLAALPDTAGTRFGQIAAGQAACLALTALLLAARRGPGWLSAMAASGTLLGQGLHAHAAQDGALALAIELAHLLAAACWLGALPSLLLAAALSPGSARPGWRHGSRPGAWCGWRCCWPRSWVSIDR